MNKNKLLTVNDLDDYEINLISKHRKDEERKKSVTAFQHKAIRIAHKWSIWSKKHQYGLTFSTFCNDFGYQDKDHQSMYYAVEKLILTARECANDYL